MKDIKIEGGTATMQRLVRGAFARYPSWYVDAARVAKVVITDRPDVKQQIAMYEHGTRVLYVTPGVGDILTKAIGHELAHGVDDIFGEHHFFTANPEWVKIHRNQSYFDIPKYRDEPLEYLADMMVKLFMLGPQKLSTTNPDEVRFITAVVFPTIQKEFT